LIMKKFNTIIVGMNQNGVYIMGGVVLLLVIMCYYRDIASLMEGMVSMSPYATRQGDVPRPTPSVWADRYGSLGAEQMSNLCEMSRERKGNVLTMEQNRCNPTTDGRTVADDWMCRNDGYSGYNVASVGEESASVSQSRRINDELVDLVLSPLGADNMVGQMSRPGHVFRPKREDLQESMVVNVGGDPFYSSIKPVFETDAGNPNPYKNRAGSPTEGFATFAERNRMAMEALEDIDYSELAYIDKSTADAISAIELARKGDIDSLMAVAETDPALKMELTVIDSPADIVNLNKLLDEKLAKQKAIGMVAEIKARDPSSIVTEDLPIKQIEAVYREVVKTRRSRVIGPYPLILAPNECDYEGKWTTIMPSNTCQPSLVGAMGSAIRELFGAVGERFTGTLLGSYKAPCGKGHSAGEIVSCGYCRAQNRMPFPSAPANILNMSTNDYKSFEKHCASDFNHSGGNDRQIDGGAWKGERYPYGCKYPMM
jgi:hypothetical protein